MAIKEYKDDCPVTIANEPAVAYRKVSHVQARTGRSQSMSVDEYIDKVRETLDQLEAKSTPPPPCQYTEEEVVQRVLQATADVDAGRGLVSHEEFKKQVRSWLK